MLERVWIIVAILKSIHSDMTLCKRNNIIITDYNNSSLT